MNWTRNLALNAVVCLLLAQTVTPVGGKVNVVDISGTWQWRAHLITMIPPFLAEIVGIEPEGPTTHSTCEAWGTLDLVQLGDTFTGTATQSILCTTRGGQQYSPPFPTLVPFSGVINGASMNIDFGECPYVAHVNTENGAAVSLNGTGHCKVPLHPAALLSVSFDATR